MKTALSTACFFPELPEDEIKKVRPLGFSRAEIFINTDYETSAEYLKTVKNYADSDGIEIISVHTPYGYAEPYFFFSPYKRRSEESLEKYKRMFENIASVFGEGTKYIFHGGHASMADSLKLGIEYYIKLNEIAKKCGIIFCQENVNKYTFSSPDNIKALLKEYPEANFVIDIKQAVRSGYSPFDVAEAMGRNIRHFHINDNTAEKDCLLPGKGDFPLDKFVKQLAEQGFDGDTVIEVYRHSYGDEKELADARIFTEAL